ncbi:hypothetical protein [Oceanidesulfovibrio marinus]|uniref:Membrane protein YkvI n=1 Tax=Oceanidesulfovibrio marinus TaxID=370038 RepID=A0A6P1ZIY8_9BACT|nr:hypothetical protein [Oceanidesulfovibrio marinus]QJT07553.1 hypothetical protein E8L03_00855 [Oceanidesulfovibrio marinus]TVM34532.1 hypothetical protein DQK91_08130 [Oceanidesulfovibrio marinus]
MNKGLVLTIAGAILAFLIGSGFASGQEILQYFAAYQYQSILVGITIILVLAFANYCFVYAGNREKFTKGSEVFNYFCGPFFGRLFDYFAAIFCYMSFVVMLGGISATVEQQFGIPGAIGAVGLAICAGLTVIFGLNTIVNIISKIGPALMILAILIGICALARSWGSLAEGVMLIKTKQVTVMQASTHWLFAGCSYGGFCLVWLAGFMAQLGSEYEHNGKELQLGQILGVSLLVFACIIVSLAQVADIRDVAGTQVPNLILAQKLAPVLAHVFAAIIVLSIYTTSCPLLWTVCARFTEQGSKEYKGLTVILAIAGCFVALKIPFNTLVNYIYVLNGYVGALLIIFMAIKMVRLRFGASPAPVGKSLSEP